MKLEPMVRIRCENCGAVLFEIRKSQYKYTFMARCDKCRKLNKGILNDKKSKQSILKPYKTKSNQR